MRRALSPSGWLRAFVLAISFAGFGSVASAQVALSITGADASAVVNGFRTAARIPGVAPDPILTALATQQALAMAASGTMSHTIAGALQDRLASGGYAIRAAAENIGYGQPTLDAVFASWMQSAPHRANILDRGMSYFGLGAASVNGVIYWALILATPR